MANSATLVAWYLSLKDIMLCLLGSSCQVIDLMY